MSTIWVDFFSPARSAASSTITTLSLKGWGPDPVFDGLRTGGGVVVRFLAVIKQLVSQTVPLDFVNHYP